MPTPSWIRSLSNSTRRALVAAGSFWPPVLRSCAGAGRVALADFWQAVRMWFFHQPILLVLALVMLLVVWGQLMTEYGVSDLFWHERTLAGLGAGIGVGLFWSVLAYTTFLLRSSFLHRQVEAQRARVAIALQAAEEAAEVAEEEEEDEDEEEDEEDDAQEEHERFASAAPPLSRASTDDRAEVPRRSEEARRRVTEARERAKAVAAPAQDAAAVAEAAQKNADDAEEEADAAEKMVEELASIQGRLRAFASVAGVLTVLAAIPMVYSQSGTIAPIDRFPFAVGMVATVGAFALAIWLRLRDRGLGEAAAGPAGPPAGPAPAGPAPAGPAPAGPAPAGPAPAGPAPAPAGPAPAPVGPAAVVQTPASVVQTPASVVQTPAAVVQSPAPVDPAPAGADPAPPPVGPHTSNQPNSSNEQR